MFILTQKDHHTDFSDKFLKFIAFVRKNTSAHGTFYCTTNLQESMKEFKIKSLAIHGCYVSSDFLTFDYYVSKPTTHASTATHILTIVYKNNDYEFPPLARYAPLLSFK